MKKRNIKKQTWVNEEEAQALAEKAKRCCLTEASLLRMMITDKNIKEQPSKEFFVCLKGLYKLGANINQVYAKFNSLGIEDKQYLMTTVKRINDLITNCENELLNCEGK